MINFKNRVTSFYRKILIFYFRELVGNNEFCIISNDCWGGEVYKILGRRFNTPFIGLMVMSPCYIKLLENLEYHLSLPLQFKDRSKYGLVQDLQQKKKIPIGVLGNTDIEIIFLHYSSNDIAKEKWERRIERIDWQNLFIKYDCGKDYADKESVEKFIAMPFANKLLFGNENFGKKEVIILKKYSPDALVQFRNCFLNFNPFGWLTGDVQIKNCTEKTMCKKAAKYI